MGGTYRLDKNAKLTDLTEASGCAAKIGPGVLSGILAKLPDFSDDRLLVGLDTSDDGAVYKINEETAMIQTLDFFPPMTDDPYLYGQVAATNALSDIYAMGGKPAVALNIVMFPDCLPTEVLEKILQGGASKVKEAGALLVGGHSISDREPKYGLSVTGFVHPDKMLTNADAKPGDALILTKPLGIGIVNTARKAELASEEAVSQALKIMTTLNKKACEVFEEFSIHGCTDVTGFSLMGHGVEMAKASKATLEIDSKKLAYIKEAYEYADMGLIPAGAYRNRAFVKEDVCVETKDMPLIDICFDPQTSGGLLVSVPEEESLRLLKRLQEESSEMDARIIGRVVEKKEKCIYLK